MQILRYHLFVQEAKFLILGMFLSLKVLLTRFSNKAHVPEDLLHFSLLFTYLKCTGNIR